MPRSLLFRKLILALQDARQKNLQVAGKPIPVSINSLQVTRRNFLKGSMALGAAGLVTGCFPLGSSSSKSSKPKIAIVGAGIAGLNAAYQLKKQGFSATVYEASQRVGGRMMSVTWEDGLVVDMGAELINTDHEDMLNLVEELEIELFNRVDDVKVLTFPRVVYFFEGKSILESDLVEDLRLIVEQITIDAALLDTDWETNAPVFDLLSVEDYLTNHASKITKPYITELFKDVMRTEFGVELNESSSLQFIQVLPAIDGQTVNLLSYSDEVYSVIGGSSAITDALAKKVSGDIKLGKILTKIKSIDAKYELSFSDGSSTEVDIAIVAIPFAVLSGITIEANLSDELVKFIGQAKLGLNEKIIGNFSSRVWRSASGFTDALWSDLGIAEFWDETSRQSTRTDGALNFFIGGDQVKLIKETDTATTVGSNFVDQLDKYLSGAKTASKGKFIKSNWTNNPYITGGYANYKPGELTEFGDLFWIESDVAEEKQEVRSNNLFFIGEHVSDAYYGFMNGGAQTGRLVATLIISEINIPV